MKKIRTLLLNVIFIFLLSSIITYAHPGKTDASGGHYDHQNGGYHYHHGYSAHSHTDGVCPYEYHDKTDHSSNKNNSSELRQNTNTTNSQDKDLFEEKEEKTFNWKNIIGIAFGLLLCYPLVLLIYYFIYYKIIQPIIEYIKRKK